MRVTWVNPCFLHYRVPVYAALDRLLGGRLTVLFSAERTPRPVAEKLADALGERAVGLRGERCLNLGAGASNFANVGWRLPYQPGLLGALSAGRPDVVVSEGFFGWTPVSLWYKLRNRVPLVIAYERTAHTERNAGFLRTSYRRWVARRTDAVACNGSLSKQYCVRKLCVPETRIVTGAMAADSEALTEAIAGVPLPGEPAVPPRRAPVRRAAVPVWSRPVFLYAGRLIRLKGLRELLAAWKRYTRDQANPGTLVLVGAGPERGFLQKTVHDNSLFNVVFVGAVPPEELARFYRAADVLVMPTLEDNWSLVVPEAMACGLPVLCSCFNGCWPELVHPGRNGWVFDPRETAGFSSLLADVHRQRQRLPVMGRESGEIVRDFTPRHAAEALWTACRMAFADNEKRAAS